MNASTHSSRGIALVLLAAMLWGTTGTAQSLAPAALSPYWIGALRLVIATAFFALLVVRAPAQAPAGTMPWRAMLAAGLCVATYNLSFFAGVKQSGVALGTAVAIGSGPIWAGLLQTLVQRRLPSALWWLGTCIGVAGGVAMALDGGAAQRAPWSGILLCLLAGLSYAAYALLNKPLVGALGPARANLAVFGAAAVFSVPVAWALGGALQNLEVAWPVVLYLGLVSTGVAYLLFSSALRYISGATGVTLALAEPVTAFALAVLVVGETPSWLAYLGLACVLGGLLLVIGAELRETRKAQPEG
jgi:DME family drug/metabolite transporter